MRWERTAFVLWGPKASPDKVSPFQSPHSYRSSHLFRRSYPTVLLYLTTTIRTLPLRKCALTLESSLNVEKEVLVYYAYVEVPTCPLQWDNFTVGNISLQPSFRRKVNRNISERPSFLQFRPWGAKGPEKAAITWLDLMGVLSWMARLRGIGTLVLNYPGRAEGWVTFLQLLRIIGLLRWDATQL